MRIFHLSDGAHVLAGRFGNGVAQVTTAGFNLPVQFLHHFGMLVVAVHRFAGVFSQIKQKLNRFASFGNMQFPVPYTHSLQIFLDIIEKRFSWRRLAF